MTINSFLDYFKNLKSFQIFEFIAECFLFIYPKYTAVAGFVNTLPENFEMSERIFAFIVHFVLYYIYK